ncbi:MAG: hypothetical protein HOP02_05045 [Methylococcaceae bacterium]|nr:hypothetical protein [Methylococcaceae bacterium]
MKMCKEWRDIVANPLRASMLNGLAIIAYGMPLGRASYCRAKIRLPTNPRNIRYLISIDFFSGF